MNLSKMQTIIFVCLLLLTAVTHSFFIQSKDIKRLLRYFPKLFEPDYKSQALNYRRNNDNRSRYDSKGKLTAKYQHPSNIYDIRDAPDDRYHHAHCDHHDRRLLNRFYTDNDRLNQPSGNEEEYESNDESLQQAHPNFNQDYVRGVLVAIPNFRNDYYRDGSRQNILLRQLSFRSDSGAQQQYQPSDNDNQSNYQ